MVRFHGDRFTTSTSQSPYVTWPQTVPLPQYMAQHKLRLLSRDPADLPATRIVSEGLPLLSETDHAQSKYTVKPDSLNLEYATPNQGKRRIQAKIEYTIDSKSVVFRVFIPG
jgi:hypothetical protein